MLKVLFHLLSIHVTRKRAKRDNLTLCFQTDTEHFIIFYGTRSFLLP